MYFRLGSRGGATNIGYDSTHEAEGRLNINRPAFSSSFGHQEASNPLLGKGVDEASYEAAMAESRR